MQLVVSQVCEQSFNFLPLSALVIVLWSINIHLDFSNNCVIGSAKTTFMQNESTKVLCKNKALFENEHKVNEN